jgi:hypothetical protein
MAHYNFEEQLQRKLNERSIAPTGNAWERIAYNRQLQEKKKIKTIIYWIAAAVVIAFGSLSLLFQQGAAVPENRVVVKETPMVPQTLPLTGKSAETEAVASETVIKPHPIEQYQTVIIPGSASVDPAPEPFTNTEAQKTEEVVAALNTMAQSEPVDENEVDALLKKAQRDIVMERTNKNQTATNSSELLDNAEKEVDRTFKDKVFDLFHKKFRTIKIALSDD